MIVTVSNRYIVAYKSNRDYTASQRPLEGKEYLYKSLVGVRQFTVSGYNYKDKQNSAYEQCIILLEMLKKYECSTQTLFMIVGWIQAKASQFGLITRLRKEGYYD